MQRLTFILALSLGLVACGDDSSTDLGPHDQSAAAQDASVDHAVSVGDSAVESD
jgi:hypothetical protein